eukprot:RCo046754
MKTTTGSRVHFSMLLFAFVIGNLLHCRVIFSTANAILLALARACLAIALFRFLCSCVCALLDFFFWLSTLLRSLHKSTHPRASHPAQRKIEATLQYSCGLWLEEREGSPSRWFKSRSGSWNQRNANVGISELAQKPSQLPLTRLWAART